MKRRDERTEIEINSHMAKAKSATQVGMPFAVDEYSCLICNAYFRKKIFQSDLEIIADLRKFFWMVGNSKNASTIEAFLEAQNFFANNNYPIESKIFKNCEHRIPTEGSSLGLQFIKKNFNC